MDRLAAEHLWSVTEPADLTIAVVDSGVDGNHPDLVRALTPVSTTSPGPAPGSPTRTVTGPTSRGRPLPSPVTTSTSLASSPAPW